VAGVLQPGQQGLGHVLQGHHRHPARQRADPVAMADMLNALDPAHPVRVPCLVVLPVTGPVGPVPAF
jgi:hypothetical protein